MAIELFGTVWSIAPYLLWLRVKQTRGSRDKTLDKLAFLLHLLLGFVKNQCLFSHLNFKETFYYPFRGKKEIVNPPSSNPQRQIVKKLTLSEEGNDTVYSEMTAEQRVLMVWPLTLTAWKFAKPNGFESRLQRHVARIERR